jgi:hypothetical protein
VTDKKLDDALANALSPLVDEALSKPEFVEEIQENHMTPPVFEPDREAANKWTDSASMGLTKRDGHIAGQKHGWNARGEAVLPLLKKIEGVEMDEELYHEIAALIAQIRAEG